MIHICMILSRVVVLNHYWRITERIKTLMYNKLTQLCQRESGPRHQWGQFHGHVASAVTQELRRACTWGFIFCSHHLWLLNDFIFPFGCWKWSPVGHMGGPWSLSPVHSCLLPPSWDRQVLSCLPRFLVPRPHSGPSHSLALHLPPDICLF